MRLFTSGFGHFKVRRPPPCPQWSMLEKVGWIFSFQSFTQNWIGGEGGIYAVVAIIFAPDCSYDLHKKEYLINLNNITVN
jgi:hypothetical protein